MIAQLDTTTRYSPEDYLAQEITSDNRHEYLDGEIVPMTGGTPNHNQILLNLAGTLNFWLRQQPYRVFAADQRLWIPQRRIYTYPDVFIVAEPIQLQEGRNDTLINPVLIIEVLSESTRAYDKDGKFAAYRTISSVQEYLLVDQYQPQIDHYNDRQWAFVDYDDPEASLTLHTFPIQLPLTDLYAKVEFAAIAP